jgi:hypothetical protein
MINRATVIRKSVREAYSDDGIWGRVDAITDKFNYGTLHDAVVISLVSSPMEMPALERVDLCTIPEQHAPLLIINTLLPGRHDWYGSCLLSQW